MRVYLGRLRVESCDELPLLARGETPLALDDNNLVCPDGVTESFDIRILTLIISMPPLCAYCSSSEPLPLISFKSRPVTTAPKLHFFSCGCSLGTSLKPGSESSLPGDMLDYWIICR